MRKIIAIIDNGLPQEDHQVHFVTIDADKVEQLKILFNIGTDWISYNTVIGIADRVRWVVKTPAVLVEDFVHPYYFDETSHAQWHRLDKRFRKWLIARWSRIHLSHLDVSLDMRGNIARLKAMK